MILTSELRSTNLVELEGAYIPVSRVTTIEAIQAIKPILLSLKLFKKAGFKTNDTEVYKTDPNTANIFCIDIINKEFYFNTGTFKKKLEHLHQVQNLYLDLFGEEMQIEF